MSNDKVFKYVRYMRDGSVAEKTGIVNDPKRKRNGKTVKDHNKRKHTND